MSTRKYESGYSNLQTSQIRDVLLKLDEVKRQT